ncbi:vWA domain-containing protein [Stenotrophomonas forensis]|uniref:vWA domain-containing protein n=1 Tax=Stenotrophomonas forensis TaxID=2871169 RepID=UPI0039C70E6F
MRRLPVFILADVSGSMLGEPIEAVRTGVQTMLSSLRQDPYALETAYISIITFSDTAQNVVPLTELVSIQAPDFKAGGTTALGAALKELARSIERDVRKSSPEQKGDWKPLVFLLTDGAPTDNLQEGINEIRNAKIGTFVACAAGPNADTTELSKITESVVRLDTLDSNSVKSFFKWVSSSVSTSSQKIESGGVDLTKGLNELPPPPPEVQVVI